jgi:EAL domain-containing protein (putative c-di-GMP-specific phosphodiesterase class I)
MGYVHLPARISRAMRQLALVPDAELEPSGVPVSEPPFLDDDRGWREVDVELLEEALATDAFRLEAQPILDLRTRRICQYELLLRLADRDGSLIPPVCFLDVAERGGIVTEIDLWVVRRAIALIAEHARLGRELHLEVNLSGRSLGDPDLLDVIEGDLYRASISPGNLIFEVTETAAVANIAKARAFVERLRELGCRFALDDFGSGFSSFYYLKHLPFDYIKIDGEFITGCRADPTDQLVIEAVVGIAHGLDKWTIAEFVPDRETARLLAQLGVDFAQGHHVGRPIPAEGLMLTPPERAGVAGYSLTAAP